MNTVTHNFNKGMYDSSNSLKFNKNSPYKGTLEDKTKILSALDEKYKIAKQRSNVPIGHKNLIYFCVFGVGYMMLFEMLLKSLIKYNDPKAFDLLIITDEHNKKAIEMIPVIKYFSYDYHIVITPDDSVEASMCKIYVHDYFKINDYKTILFLDTDIICIKNIEYLFDKKYEKLEVADSGYSSLKRKEFIPAEVISSATIAHSLCFFSEENKKYIIEEDPLVFNAGHFLFTNTEQMKFHFENVRWLTKVWPSIYFYEQSFMNHYFVLKQECNFNVLSLIVNLISGKMQLENEAKNVEKISERLKLVHFAEHRISAKHKYKFIKMFLEKNQICL